MDFKFTDEQTMVFETAAAFLAEASDSAAVRSAMVAANGYQPGDWQRLCEEMYWQAILIPEAHDGLGLGFVEIAGILEKMGERLYCGPFIASAVVATSALAAAGSDQQQASCFPRLLAGQTAALAYLGRSDLWDSGAVTATLVADGDNWRLNGDYQLVAHAAGSDFLLLAAKRPNGELAIAIVETDSAGVTITGHPTMDQTRPLATVTAVDVTVTAGQLLNSGGCCAQLVDDLADIGAISLAADQVGGSQQSLTAAVDYTQERVQFGRTIASFQAIKHKAADMMLKVEAGRSALYYAACVAELWRQSSAAPGQLAEAAAMAKSYCSDAYYFVSGTAVQLFGGVGITAEYDIQLYFKRAKSTESYLGSGNYHRERLAEQLLGPASPADQEAL